MFAQLLEKLTRREDLTADEASLAMDAIMEERATPGQVAGLLMGLAMKGERPPEIVGLARAMREHAVPFAAGEGNVMDVCGTGGDRAGTFNISSMTALLVAAAGVRVAKHGNRSVSSRCGSADVFEALGVKTTAPVAMVERSLEVAGIAFLFAPSFHPSMRYAAGVRRELGLRTAFNLLGPLTNPARPRRQLVGVPRPELTELIARALAMLGSERAWVVHGADGLDEITTTGPTLAYEIRDGAFERRTLEPGDFGVPVAAAGNLRGGDAARNLAIAKAVLAGERGPQRDIVLANAAAALVAAGKAEVFLEGAALAAVSIDTGAARRKVEALAAFTS